MAVPHICMPQVQIKCVCFLVEVKTSKKVIVGTNLAHPPPFCGSETMDRFVRPYVRFKLRYEAFGNVSNVFFLSIEA